MLRFLGRRVLMAIPVMVGAVTLSFLALYLIPGDAVTVLLGSSPSTPEVRAQLREEFKLDDPMIVRYTDFLVSAAKGDLGESINQQRPVRSIIADQLPHTLRLTAAATALTVVLGVGLGLLTSVGQRPLLDRAITLASVTATSLPSYAVGVLLISFFSFQLRWLPGVGDEGWKTLVLPVVALAIPGAAIITQLVRSGMQQQRRQQYVLTARAKGLAPWAIAVRHTLRNALIAPITVLGAVIGNLLGGAVIIETVFSRRGIGRLAVQSIDYKDLPLLQGIVLVAAISYVTLNILIDLLYAAVDPRVRDTLLKGRLER